MGILSVIMAKKKFLAMELRKLYENLDQLGQLTETKDTKL